MEGIETLAPTYSSCVVELDAKARKQLGIAEDAIVIMHASDGRIEVEVLPPPTPELKATADRLHNKYKEVFEELKRLGD
jgi:hypothetical protein